jgi:hypothetical protein
MSRKAAAWTAAGLVVSLVGMIVLPSGWWTLALAGVFAFCVALLYEWVTE